MFDSLWFHGLQYSRPPCPSPTPGIYSNSCPLSQWCHPTISSSVIPFSSRLRSFPASGSFPMSQFFTLGGQSTGVSASASVLPMNIQDWFPLGWTGWISLQSNTLKSLLQQHNSLYIWCFISSVQLLSHVWLFVTPRAAACPASLYITNSWSLLKLTCIESVTPSNHLTLCRPLLLPPSIFPSIRVFSNESVLHIRWPKYWSFSFSISTSNEYSGLTSFSIDSPCSPRDS